MKDWSVGWYCIRAKPRQEMVASATLSTLDTVEVFLPRTQRARKAKSGPSNPFPWVLFCPLRPCQHLRNVHYARGVAYIVTRKGVPVHVHPQVMIELRLLSPDGIVEIPDQPHKIGDNIKVISGLFKGDEGVVTNSSLHGSACVYFLKFLVVPPKWKLTNMK
jgi:hypothetical protein